MVLSTTIIVNLTFECGSTTLGFCSLFVLVSLCCNKMKITLGIVGVTGAVGVEIMECLKTKNVKVDEILLFASSRSVGQVISTHIGSKTIEGFTVERALLCDVLLLAVSNDIAKNIVDQLKNCDSPVIIDNSSAFRYDDGIPLVIPEINGKMCKGNKLVSNPNCTTAIAAMVLWPICKTFGIKRLIISTYQAASGAGIEGMDELLTGTRQYLDNEPVQNSIFPHPLAFNLIPHIDKFQENGYTKEEMKVIWETKKIFGTADCFHSSSNSSSNYDSSNDNSNINGSNNQSNNNNTATAATIRKEDMHNMEISCTAVRIPILRAHSESITIETILPTNIEEIRTLLLQSPGVYVRDDIANYDYPMPINATKQYDIQVGRIRKSMVFNSSCSHSHSNNSNGNSNSNDLSSNSSSNSNHNDKYHGIDLFISGDQLLRGAAYNVILILEQVLQHIKENN